MAPLGYSKELVGLTLACCIALTLSLLGLGLLRMEDMTLPKKGMLVRLAESSTSVGPPTAVAVGKLGGCTWTVGAPMGRLMAPEMKEMLFQGLLQQELGNFRVFLSLPNTSDWVFPDAKATNLRVLESFLLPGSRRGFRIWHV